MGEAYNDADKCQMTPADHPLACCSPTRCWRQCFFSSSHTMPSNTTSSHNTWTVWLTQIKQNSISYGLYFDGFAISWLTQSVGSDQSLHPVIIWLPFLFTSSDIHGITSPGKNQKKGSESHSNAQRRRQTPHRVLFRIRLEHESYAAADGFDNHLAEYHILTMGPR
jgi:hypothetical protein